MFRNTNQHNKKEGMKAREKTCNQQSYDIFYQRINDLYF